MATSNTSELDKSVNQVLTDLEKVADQIRVKLHLASRDANTTWNDKLEPRLFEARNHVREAKVASEAAVNEALKAFKEFAASL